MFTESETRGSLDFVAGETAADRVRWLPDGEEMVGWLMDAMCAVTAPFVLLTRLRRRLSTGRDLERLDRHVLADIGLVKADVVAAVNGQVLAQAVPANTNVLCPMRGGNGGAA